jgi:hypothetical protein
VLLSVHGNQLAFFQTAATLIPLLLFGGVVAESLKPGGNEDEDKLWSMGWRIAFVGTYAIAAEVLAIDAVVTGEWKWWTEIFVALFVAGGMAGVVFVLVRPWYKALNAKSEEGENRAWRLKVAAIAAILGIGIWGGIEMLSNVDRAGESQRLEAIIGAISQKTAEATAVESRTLALSIALARARRQLVVATARHKSEAVLEGFFVERKTLRVNLSKEENIENALREKLKELRLLEGPVVSKG